MLPPAPLALAPPAPPTPLPLLLLALVPVVVAAVVLALLVDEAALEAAVVPAALAAPFVAGVDTALSPQAIERRTGDDAATAKIVILRAPEKMLRIDFTDLVYQPSWPVQRPRPGQPRPRGQPPRVRAMRSSSS